MIKVIKRNNRGEEPFDIQKIITAITNAGKSQNEKDLEEKALDIADNVYTTLKSKDITEVSVDEIHTLVENELMRGGSFDTARAYITYRNEHRPDIFRKRTVYKPFEYPALHKYVDAIRQSYWTHDEYDYTGDIQDFKVNMTGAEQEAVRRCMLAISHIEVTVKMFWAKLSDKLPKPEIAEVGITFGESECFDDQTEILCNNGWKYFSELTYKDKVAQYNTEEGIITYTQPSNIIVKPYTGVLHHYKGKSTDICVTPKHELLVRHPNSSKYSKKRSESGKWSKNYYYPVSGKAVGELDEFTAKEAFLIALQADGSLFGNCPTGKDRRDFTFTLQKERKIVALKRLMNSLSIKYKEKLLSNGQTRLWGTLPKDFPEVSTIKTFGWLNPEKCSYSFGRAFIKELGNWDSTVRGSNIVYYNSNIEAIDKVQHLAVISEYSAYKSINRTKEQTINTLAPNGNKRLSAKDIYVLSITDKTEKLYPNKYEVDYDGTVYCATVPEGAIVVRRNGSACIQGNCRHANAYAELLNILGLNDDFKEIKEVPVIKARQAYMEKAINTGNISDKEYMESILLFSLFIENVSLFSQFLILSMINQKQGYLKGISNAINATSLEENLHAMFGADIINIIREEHPEWFDHSLDLKVSELVQESYQAEKAIIEWIFELGEIQAAPKQVVIEYIKKRYNEGLESAGFKPLFQIDHEVLKDTEFFDLQLNTTTHVDFFHKRSPNYTKKAVSFDADSLF